ncbi:MAG: electron transfer flavoprotein subunit beta/FixA family protein [Acidobacteria bacterium]|nr:electron transfer flavoprotein subunit beta/FixA family protein [Acidobacteriota bacterium]
MKIAVCMKQVPAKDAPLRINDAGTWVREGDISYETCEPDNYALEAALQLKEKHGGEVVVVSLGPERVRQVIKEGLAKGAERALHIQDDQFFQLDPLQMAAALAGAVREEKFDLILTGLQSDDHGYGQTGVILAERLGLPHATIIMEIQVAEGKLRVKRELEGGWFQWITLPLPAVLTIQSGINKPRYASLKGIMAAKKKEIRAIARAEALKDAPAATLQAQKIYVPQKTKKTEFLDGAPKEVAAKLLEKLKHEARVL